MRSILRASRRRSSALRTSPCVNSTPPWRSRGTPALLRRHGFGRRRYFDSLVCTRAGRVIGYAVYYFAYSTFSCGPVLFVEDIYVLPEERGRGAGKALMIELARIAVHEGCNQMEWLSVQLQFE